MARRASRRLDSDVGHFPPFAALRLAVEQPSLKVERLPAESNAESWARDCCFTALSELVFAQLEPLYTRLLLPARSAAAALGSIESGPAGAPAYVHLDGPAHPLQCEL
jgi:hypothetical protein